MYKEYAKSYKKNLTFYTKSYIIKMFQRGIKSPGTVIQTVPGQPEQINQ
nr:MAG TPA: hypothetical protein [Bacteriophage sp.]